jgi:hypothetical protein
MEEAFSIVDEVAKLRKYIAADCAWERSCTIQAMRTPKCVVCLETNDAEMVFMLTSCSLSIRI